MLGIDSANDQANTHLLTEHYTFLLTSTDLPNLSLFTLISFLQPSHLNPTVFIASDPYQSLHALTDWVDTLISASNDDGEANLPSIVPGLKPLLSQP